jgi:hypothetical protein
MRTGAWIIIAGVAWFGVGCASKPKPAASADATTQPIERPQYEASLAGSLVFDPPVTVGQPPLELSRDARNPSAYVGYETSITTYFFLLTDDRMTNDRSDRYERRAISAKTSITYR